MRTARLTVGLASVAIATCVLAYVFQRAHTRAGVVAVDASAPSASALAAPADCDALVVRYRAALDTLQTCAGDDECVADERGKVWSALDGCARFRRRDADLARSLEPLESAWLARGCSRSIYMTCAPERAQCRAGRCAELPREPIPRDWRRITHRGKFSFFVPADAAQDKDVRGEDTEVGEWKTPRTTINFDYGQYGTNIQGSTSEGNTLLRREPVTVGDSKGFLVLTRMRESSFIAGIHLPELGNSISRYESVLTLWTSCTKRTDCEAEGLLTARSLELH